MAGIGASIDVGSNTTLFLLGQIENDGHIIAVDEAQYYNSLGEDVFLYGAMTEETIKRNVAILTELKVRARCGKVDKIVAAGTSALRKAKNTSTLIEQVIAGTGIEIQIIPGEEEARLSYQGFLSGRHNSAGKFLVVDIGGGSSEIVCGNGEEAESAVSLATGAVKLVRKFDLGNPPRMEKYREMVESLSEFSPTAISTEIQGREVFFSGGTASTLATVKSGLKQYDRNRTEGLKLRRNWIEDLQGEFLRMDLEERERALSFDVKRAGIIIGGTAVILFLLQIWNLEEIRITHRGLRYGLLRQHFFSHQ